MRSATTSDCHAAPQLDTFLRCVESERRATMLSVQSVASNLAMAVVWPLAGVVADRSGLEAAFGMYAAGVLALGGGAFLLWSRAERGRPG